jgi:hypothetical protein
MTTKKMPKIYLVEYIDNYFYEYVAYHIDKTHCYLVCIEPNAEGDKYIRINIADRFKKEITSHEPYYTYTWGINKKRVYQKI